MIQNQGCIPYTFMMEGKDNGVIELTVFSGTIYHSKCKI
jgi:hypothetical protein